MNMTLRYKLHDPKEYEWREQAADREAVDQIPLPPSLGQAYAQFRELIGKLVEYEAKLGAKSKSRKKGGSLLLRVSDKIANQAKGSPDHKNEADVRERLWQATLALKRAEWMAFDLTEYILPAILGDGE